TMADVNVNAPAKQVPSMAPPTRTDDQILPRSSWVPVGKSNCYLDVEKSQSNPIYKIAVDILKHTKFFRAFTASSIIPSIYIQQFCDTERLQRLRDQELRCYRFFGASSIEPILIMQRGCGKNSPNPSILSSKTKRIGHCILKERRKPILFAKGTKQEVFGIPIPNDLITDDIRGEQYYNVYLEKVAKHQRYLAGEKGSDPDSPVPKPATATKLEATKKSKPSAPKAAPVTKLAATKASKSTSSQQSKPTPAKP
ncbi:hypothetical protein Tco_1007814, partial [Tanacetum coccineum]